MPQSQDTVVDEEVVMRAKNVRSAKMTARRIAFTYLAVATVWILGSDLLDDPLPTLLSPQVVEMLVGVLFVVVTTVLLWVIVLRWASRYAEQVDIALNAQRKLRQVMRTVSVGVVLTDGDGRISFLNPAAETILGIDRSEAVGSMLTEVAKPLDASLTSVDEFMRVGCVDGLEVRGSGDGSARVLIARGATLDSQAVGADEWVIALTDVTDSHGESTRIKRLVDGYRFMSRALHLVDTARNREQLFESVCAAAVSGDVFAAAWVAASDVATGRLQTFASVGLPPGTLQRIEDQMAPGGDSLGSRIAKRLQEGELDVVNDLRESTSFIRQDPDVELNFGSKATFEVKRPDATVVVVTLFSAEIGFFDLEQIHLVETLREAMAFALEKLHLDERRLEAEESLARSEAAYRDIFEKHPVPMWVFDRATLRFLAVNEATIRKYGFSREEFETMTVLDIRPGEDLSRFLHSVAHQVPGSEESGFWTHIDKSGRAFTVHVHSNLVNWFGADAQVVLVQEVATMD